MFAWVCAGSPAPRLQAEWVWWGCDWTLLFCNRTSEQQTGGDQRSWCGKSLFSVKIWPCLWFSCSRCEADTLIWTSGTVCFCLDWSSWWEADSRRTLSVKYLIYITADRLLKHAPCLSPCQASKPACSHVSLTEEPLWSKCFSSLLQDPSRSGCLDVNMELLWFFTLNLLSICAHRYFPDRVRIRHNASTQLQYRELNPSCGVNKNKECSWSAHTGTRDFRHRLIIPFWFWIKTSWDGITWLQQIVSLEGRIMWRCSLSWVVKWYVTCN